MGMFWSYGDSTLGLDKDRSVVEDIFDISVGSSKVEIGDRFYSS